MLRILSLFALGLLAASVLTACGNPATAPTQLKIEPEDCSVNINEQIALTLSGVVPPNALITWTSTSGNVVTAPLGINAQFVAPNTPGRVVISVTVITPGTPSSQPPLNLECKVNGPQTVDPSTPNNPPSTLSGPSGAASDIIISEVMSTPCGGDNFKQWNQYVELYNKGNDPVDVRGWWLLDPGPFGTPDSLVAWDDRSPTKPLMSNLITNTTVIPSHRFAVILSPLYVNGIMPYQMPYNFPANTIILTIKDSDRLGDDKFGIVGTGIEPDFVALYIGGSNSVMQVVSTYGNPATGKYPADFHDTSGDDFPFTTSECISVERQDPNGPDRASNWRLVQSGSPGQAPYLP